MNTPPSYNETLENHDYDSERYSMNKYIYKQLRDLLDSIDEIEETGVSHDHQYYIQQLMKGFDKNYIYKNFNLDYEYVIKKLSLKICSENNYALRSINEALQ